MDEKGCRVFTGPLFIIGMPRSGTKLLRGLLNEHPKIGIPDIETEFLPYWVRQWKHFGNLHDPVRFKNFYCAMMDVPYFIYMRERGRLIQENAWYSLSKSYDLQGVFEALIRHDAGADPGTSKIWGDKSPSYIRHLPLLKNLFPNARFIHIIRDVRDYCISINKAWGQNMLRAAMRWTESLHKVKNDFIKFPNDYLEVKYEELLEDPECELKRICAFLGLDFDKRMLVLSHAPEDIGLAKGAKKIISDNKNKYLKTLKPDLCSKIESIAKPMLESYGYPLNYLGPPIKISKVQMIYYQLIDGLNLVKSEKKRTILGALSFQWQSFKMSGNRKT